MARRRVAKPVTPTASSAAPARVLLALLAVLTFANGLPNDFTYDDLSIARDNPRLESPASAGQLLTTGYWGPTSDVYRPVVLVSFAVQRWIHGTSAPLLRAGNVLLHALVVVLLFEWLLALGLDRAACLAAAALFAVVPIHAEAVTSIVGRAELMAAAFSLISALAWLKATRGRTARGRWGGIAAGAFGLALLSKESAAALPAVIILAEAMSAAAPGESPRERWKRIAILVGGGATVLVAVLGARLLVLGGVLRSPDALPTELTNPLSTLSPGVRLLNAANFLWLYAAKCLVPVRLSADYSAWALRPIRELADARLWLGVAGWAAGAWAALRWRRAAPEAAFGFLLFPVAFLPTANVFFAIGTGFAERLAYFPSAGVALLAGGALVRAGRSLFRVTSPGRREVLLPGALVLLLVPVTFLRNRDWRDDRSLFESTVQAQPLAARGHYLRAFDAYRRGELRESEEALRKAVEIYRPFQNAWDLLGEVLWRQRKYEAALAAQRTNVELFPRSADTLYYLALWTAQVGRVDEARSLLLRGVSLFPAERSFPEGLRVLADGRSSGAADAAPGSGAPRP